MGSEDSLVYKLVETRYTVESVTAGGVADVISLQERATIRQGGSEGPVTWDSTSGMPIPKDMAIAAIAAWTGVPVRYCIDSRGEILSEEGIDAVKSRYREALGRDFLGIGEVAFSLKGGVMLGAPLASAPVKKG